MLHNANYAIFFIQHSKPLCLKNSLSFACFFRLYEATKKSKKLRKNAVKLRERERERERESEREKGLIDQSSTFINVAKMIRRKQWQPERLNIQSPYPQHKIRNLLVKFCQRCPFWNLRQSSPIRTLSIKHSCDVIGKFLFSGLMY